ncbi:putative serine carboxypeptidase [Zalerion maritima]|uniref:Serine carboxypeptidase n=1 Tax=Zalerion maritima TaxID=339359 RepID=A0AAD5WTJ2_9PEZI|nr:putative serine carboxypeptidase [Zalerion maritima]
MPPAPDLETTICETTPDVKAWSGYIKLPPDVPFQNTTENLWFWYFQSRSSPSTDPLAVFIHGMFGAPSFAIGRHGDYDGAGSVGPCVVLSEDSSTTKLNDWSFNNEANVLFLDHDPDAGFSYEELYAVATEWEMGWDDHSGGRPPGLGNESEHAFASATDNWHKCKEGRYHTFYESEHEGGNTTAWRCGAQRQPTTADGRTSSAVRARVAWRFFQTFFELSPFYDAGGDDERPELSLWGYTYGAEHAYVWSEYFLEQSEKIDTGDEQDEGDNQGIPVTISSVGFIDGFIDRYKQSIAHFAYLHENYWGIQKINDSIWEEMQHELDECLPMWEKCQDQVEAHDPQRLGLNRSLVDECVDVALCLLQPQDTVARIAGYFRKDGHFDDVDWQMMSTHFGLNTGKWVPRIGEVFLNSAKAQKDLGVGLNYTFDMAVSMTSGTWYLNNGTEHISRLLESDIPVTLVGSDYNSQLGWESQSIVAYDLNYTTESGDAWDSSFWVAVDIPGVEGRAALGGLVKQAGNLALVRVLDTADTAMLSNAPALSTIFSRAIHHKDIANGSVTIDPKHDNYATPAGLESAHNYIIDYELQLDPDIPCHVTNLFTCGYDDYWGLTNGNRVIKNYWVVDPDGDDDGDENDEGAGISTLPHGVMVSLVASTVSFLVLL